MQNAHLIFGQSFHYRLDVLGISRWKGRTAKTSNFVLTDIDVSWKLNDAMIAGGIFAQ